MPISVIKPLRKEKNNRKSTMTRTQLRCKKREMKDENLSKNISGT
jgi:hypothetical protein